DPYHRTRRGVHLDSCAGARSSRSGRRARRPDGVETQHSGARSSSLAPRCDRAGENAAHVGAATGDGMTTARTPSIAAAALEYHARGWKPVPVNRKTKKPIGTGWQKRPFDPAQFNGNAQNVAIQLGAVSRGLVDVDLDSMLAVGLATEFLPPTDAIFGRRSKPCSHQLYLSDLCDSEKCAAIQFREFTNGHAGQVIVELRIGGNGKGAA